MQAAEKEENAFKAGQAKLLNQLDKELSNTKVLSMSLANQKAEQHKILDNYRSLLKSHGASK
jgi:hypothetical protein